MANFWKLGAMVWCLTVIGWLVSPVISFLVNKLLSYLDFDISRKLRELELHTIPVLKLTLADVMEQRMLIEAKDEGMGSESDLITLCEVGKDLKSALHEAEDILDLIEYHRTEKKVIGDGKSHGTLHNAVGACIAFCQRRWLGRRIEVHRAKLWQCPQSLNQQFSVLRAKLLHFRGHIEQGSVPDVLLKSASSAPESTVDIEHESATQPHTAPDAPSNSAGSTTEFRGDNEHGSVTQAPMPDALSNPQMLDSSSNSLVQMIRGWSGHLNITSCYQSISVGLKVVYSLLCSYRDWSYEAIGIQTDDTAADYVLSATDRNRLRKRIENIEHTVTDSKKSHLLNQQSRSSSTDESSNDVKEITYLHTHIQPKVFGREEERKYICSMLRTGPDADAPSKRYSVIGIHGIAGSGKSTLAQYVCDYEKEAKDKYFDPIMFILVKNFRLRDIFCDMLRDIMPDEQSDNKDIKSLRNELKEKLKGKRFLLVLDDLCVNDKNQKECDILLNTLNAGQSGSRILVTAQREDAAAAVGAQEQIRISDLEEKQYLSLFMHHALEGRSNSDYERIGKMIAEKLHRSPIAAVTVAKRLQRNKQIDFWEQTVNHDLLNKTMGALWWSYQQLGADIRRCFEYCSIFPRGYKLERDEVVAMWIAQGFVKASNEKDMEDLGQFYFEELVMFSFLSATHQHFIIHDLLRELAERVAGSDFFRIEVNDSPKDIPSEVRHLFIETYNRGDIKEDFCKLGNLNTLIIEEKREYTAEEFLKDVNPMMGSYDLIEEKVFESMFMRLRKLRVLIITVKCFRKTVFSVPESIGQMKYLRYLRFHSTFTPDLELFFPRTISKLYHMQILDVPYFKLSCAEDMACLINLRQIHAHLAFPNIGRLTKLQTIMPYFEVREEQGYDLQQLKPLDRLQGTLLIRNLGIVRNKEEALQAHLARKKRLKSLTLCFGSKHICNPDDEAEVLEGLCPPVHLKELSVCDYQGSRYPSWMLSRQHPDTPKHLYHLTLRNCSRLVSIPKDSDFFIRLPSLRIFECTWDALPDNMLCLTSLRELYIVDCENIKVLPALPQSLLHITVRGNSVLCTTCKERGHVNWQKIQHIPDIWLR